LSRQVCRVGDKNSAGGVIISGDSSVLVNNRPIAVVDSPVTPHPCCGAKGCPPSHCSARTKSNNSTIKVNGKAVVTTGSSDTCGHERVGGSTDVLIG